MAIDFNKQLVFDPKIEIVGEEVPLAAMEKTGAVLQDRYDKSYENYTKFQELAKQTEQIADPLEREKVREYIKALEPEIQDIAKKGDFHNMRWQTLALANNAANNLKIFGERAQQIQTLKSKIAETNLNPKAREYYQNQLNKITQETTYDPERKTFNFQSIVTPNLVADYDSNKFVSQATANWMADKYKNEAGNMVLAKAGQSLPNGTKAIVDGVYDTKTGKLTEKVDFNEVYNNVLKMASAERGLWDMIDRDVKIETEGMDVTPEQKEALKEKLTRQYLYDPLTGGANKAAYTSTVNENDIGLNLGASEAYNKANNVSTYKPFYVQLQSDVVPGETNATVQNFMKKPLNQIFYKKSLLEGAGPFGGKENYGVILDEAKPELLFLSQSYKNYADKLKTSTDPNDKKLYNEIVASGALSIYDALSKGKNPNFEFVENFQNKLKSGVLNNVPVPSAYKSVSASDDNWQQDELNRRYPDKIGNPIAQLEDLNAEILGSKDGIDITKGGQYKTLQGFDLFDPLTGQYNTASAALEGKGNGLKIDKPIYGETYMKVTGKVVPGTVLNATSKTPYGDLSHMGDGYTVSISGKDYIMSNRNLKGGLNAKLNDLASFGRIMREETVYPTYDITGKPTTVKVKSDNTKVYVNNGKEEIPISFELYNYALESARQQGIDPVQYLTTLTK